VSIDETTSGKMSYEREAAAKPAAMRVIMDCWNNIVNVYEVKGLEGREDPKMKHCSR
jgi:hypothetical protein